MIVSVQYDSGWYLGIHGYQLGPYARWLVTVGSAPTGNDPDLGYGGSQHEFVFWLACTQYG